MEELIRLLKQRQGSQSLNEFAAAIGIWPSTLSRYYSGQRKPSRGSLEKMVRYFTQRGDFRAVSVLTAYAFGGMYGDK